ncbi:MAG: TGS domain-containing protein [Nitrososphaerota archaeon]|nr:TGS domain-containing protein [Candidatus Calditenuaceae archaeon]MDW8072666.1 TGS domain-containing protein [Nitrososphaerota archaeon]
MPTNLPAEARHKLAEYQAARTIEEKMEVLRQALSLIPDHKGTEKLRRQLRKRLAELRDELEERRAAKTGGVSVFSVKKEGWAQVAIIGAANSGKSSLLKALTGAPTPVADYPLTTKRPYPGMMIYSGCEIQLIDLPSILTEELAETNLASKSIGIARNSDLLLIVLDASKNPLAQFDSIETLLEEYGITLRKKRYEVEVERTDSGGLRVVVMGEVEGGQEAVKTIATQLGIRSAIIKIVGDITLDQLEEELIRRPEYKKSLIAINKSEINPEQAEAAARELESRGFSVIRASALSHQLEEVKAQIFRSLDMIRVYTRKDGIVSAKPLLLKRGTTVSQLAEKIHREFVETLKYARVWGPSARVQGERVGREHVLQDGDIVEIKA